jgi:hypothetical protein
MGQNVNQTAAAVLRIPTQGKTEQGRKKEEIRIRKGRNKEG